MYDLEALPEQLRKGREHAGFTLTQLSEKLDVHPTAVNKWETTTNQPNAIVLAQIANLENLDINFYFIKDMNAREADLEHNKYVSPMEKATERLKELEKEASKNKDEDEVLNRVINHPPLYDFVESIYTWPGNWLNELKAMAFTYFNVQELQKKKRGSRSA